MVTAIQEYVGGSVVASISGTYRLRLPFGPQGARFYDLDPTGAGVEVELPDARLCSTGGPLFTIYNRDGTHSLDIIEHGDDAPIATILAGDVVELFLLSNTTVGGDWLAVPRLNAGTGSAITLGREPWTINIAQSAEGFDCLSYITAHGYAGVNPVALLVTVATGVVLSAATNLGPGLTTGELPTGSTCLLTNHGIITGKGGDGGTGGNANPPFGDPPEPGAAGGFAVRFRCSASLVNFGTIQGGGGGGGGGQGSVTQGGGGGGGGAGLRIGQGGAAPFSGGATAGAGGGLTMAGVGGTGANSGGTGGLAGVAGSAGSGGGAGAGGAAGDAIRKKTGTTLSIIRTGTISGAEVFEA